MFEQNDTNEDIKTLLENDTKSYINKPWNKLEKNIKIKLLNEFVDVFSTDNKCDVPALKQYFINCIAQNRLTKIADVSYDKDNMKILNIPGLYYNNSNHNFSLRRDGNKSILSSLTPKRNRTKKKTDKDTASVTVATDDK